ncbi:hypothetical protein E4U42_000434 [Claviceps africana]|uniref:Aminoglycoside phosphotransferase domain-containing protein n=1 Tax=Claviceps africana TaxID=83212 RepID=A0A8K0JA09_9HYPO|nr:hypothetical protein E4U42_000434 [Claviceps africana]
MTTSTTDEIERVLRLIRCADIAYPGSELLASFLMDSADRLQTARYILQRCAVVGDSDSLDLAALLADWKRLIAFFITDRPAHPPSDKAVIAAISKRDGGKCCITGLANSFWDPLVVVPLLPFGTFHVDKELHEMLGIFIGTDLLEWFSSKAANQNPYQSHWLVRRSAAAAIPQGFFRFKCENQSVEYAVITTTIGDLNRPSIVAQAPFIEFRGFSDPSSSHVENPDTSALQLLNHFSAPIRWTLVSREIAQKKSQTLPIGNWQTASLWRSLADRGATVMSMAWRLLPAFVRIRAYRGLAFLGFRMYGGSGSGDVQRIPFGMYLKACFKRNFGSLENEYAALQLVRRHTSIPVPHALDFVSDSKKSWLLMTKVPGMGLWTCIDGLSHSEERALVHDLQEALSQLRAIPKQVAPEYAITNAIGKACYDGRISVCAPDDPEQGEFVGPFVDEAAFHNRLRIRALPNFSQRNGHRILFTHGDLNMRNVLMHNGRFSGIVDFEMSGWYPEYWEYTKVHFVTKLRQRWPRIMGKVMEPFGNFEKELEIEREFWDHPFPS